MNKKIFKLIFLVLLLINFVNVFAQIDYENDYTLIDCLNGDDFTGVAFDSSMPYKSLKQGIEQTINYINENINIVGNIETASGKVFNIKVACSGVNLLDGKINLNFFGNAYNNELIIEGIDENSLIIKDTYFFLPNNSGNITFKNSNFNIGNKYNYYFYPEDNIVDFYSSGIKIINSNINLKNGYNIALSNSYYFTKFYLNGRYLNTNIHYLYNNQQLIYNSNINISLDDNYIFSIPLKLKDSKVNFINTGTGGVYDINFALLNPSKANFSTFLSNEIDLGGNNFKTVNNENFAYINNKFYNFNNFIFGSDLENINKTIFINNFIDNGSLLNISKSLNLFNNVFSFEYIDEYDINNFRKNYLEANKEIKGIFWFFNRSSIYKNFKIDISSSTLYKEITGQDIPENNQEVYIIYK